MMRRPSPGFSSRYWLRPSATAVWTWPLTSALPELRLRLALELRLGELDADDRGQAFADVVAGQVVLGVLDDRPDGAPSR